MKLPDRDKPAAAPQNPKRTRSATATLRQRRKAARPSELLDAALELFVERGFAATRAEEVAQRAGVSKGTLYLYYPSKEDLLKAVIRERISHDIQTEGLRALQQQGPASEVLREMLWRWWQRTFHSPASGVFKIIISEVRAFPEIASFWTAEVIRPGREIVGSLIQRGIREGAFRKVRIEEAAHSLVLPLIMLCIHRHSLGACPTQEVSMNPDQFVQQHLELVLQGLRS